MERNDKDKKDKKLQDEHIEYEADTDEFDEIEFPDPIPDMIETIDATPQEILEAILRKADGSQPTQQISKNERGINEEE